MVPGLARCGQEPLLPKTNYLAGIDPSGELGLSESDWPFTHVLDLVGVIVVGRAALVVVGGGGDYLGVSRTVVVGVAALPQVADVDPRRAYVLENQRPLCKKDTAVSAHSTEGALYILAR